MRSSPLSTITLGVIASLGLLGEGKPYGSVIEREPALSRLPVVEASIEAFGRSGAVRVRFALPGEGVDYPLSVSGDTSSLAYEWVRIADAVTIDSARPLSGDTLQAPADPGFYRLALVREGTRRIVEDITLAVMLPFEAKRGATIDGYRIGTYLAEKAGGAKRDRPDGFVKITPSEAQLPITKHLRLADFLPHDGQTTWPRYAAVSPRVLDKLELVLTRLADWRGDSARVHMAVEVHSGFRQPAYNRVVRNAATDSRHQYGDAVDVAIDADGDGRLTGGDARLVVRAVEEIEEEHPDLVGGMGLYTNRKLRHPYVHIDARGQRARWRG